VFYLIALQKLSDGTLETVFPVIYSQLYMLYLLFWQFVTVEWLSHCVLKLLSYCTHLIDVTVII